MARDDERVTMQTDERVKKQRPGDQPLPVIQDGPYIQTLVIEDIQTRLLIGIERYGTGLQANNGRDALQDAYEEALDLCCYLRQMIEERRLERAPRGPLDLPEPGYVGP